MVADIAKLHDDCLQYELEILDGTEELGELRNKFTKQGSLNDDIKFILPVLNAIISDAESYKDFIMKTMQQNKEEADAGIREDITED